MANEEDHHIPPVRADQVMQIMAVVVCGTISTLANEDIEAGQALFAVFVQQLSSFSKEPKTIANLLRILAEELEHGK